MQKDAPTDACKPTKRSGKAREGIKLVVIWLIDRY